MGRKSSLTPERLAKDINFFEGYGRNYLLSNGKALRLNKENLEFVNKKKDELNKKNNELKKEFKLIAEKINNKTLNFFKESKDNGELYGAIKPKEIANAFLNELKIDIKPSYIVLKKDINNIGDYNVDINLYSEVSAKVKIIVKKTENK